MNKLELAKMIGLECDDNYYVCRSDIQECIECSYMSIDWKFCEGKITVSVDKYDFTKDNLDIKEEDLIEEGDIKTCIKQIEDLLWERAADKYLRMVHIAAMHIGGK